MIGPSLLSELTWKTTETEIKRNEIKNYGSARKSFRFSFTPLWTLRLRNFTLIPRLHVWLTIQYRPFCSHSSASDPGSHCPWHRKQWPLMWNILSLIHIFFLSAISERYVWNNLREWFIYWCSFWLLADLSESALWELTALVTSWADHSFLTLLYFALPSCLSAAASLGMDDSLLLIIQQQIKAILQQITSLQLPALLLGLW